MQNHYSKFKKDSNILITCEHSSKRIPREYKNLGLKKNILLGAKDLYDPGSLEVFKILSKKLKSNYIYSNVSRLVIDYNRMIGGKNINNNTFHSGALKTNLLTEIDRKEELVEIPLNSIKDSKKFKKEEQGRFNRFVLPYLEDSREIIAKMNINEKRYIVMIHSFFPVYNGKTRKTDIGVLYDKSKGVSKNIIGYLRRNTKLEIGDNSPWKMTDVDGIFSDLEREEGVELVAFDINNKHLRDKKNIKMISQLLYGALRASLE